MGTKREPADYVAMASLRNAKWLGPVVPNANSRTWWKCLGCGRRWRTIYNALQRGGGCPDCAVRRRSEANRIGPEGYHVLAAAHGLKWIGPYPELANHRTRWECGRGHRWTQTYVKIKDGRGCPSCASAAHAERCAGERHGEEAYRAAGEAAGLDWLGPMVSSAHEKSRWRCRKCGRPWRASYHKLSQGRGCPRCRLDRRNEKLRVPAERYAKIARERGFEWLGPQVERNSHPTRWRCPKGHEWETTYACIQRGSGCHVCQDRVNGMLVSGVQRQLAHRLGGTLNLRVGRRCIDVALEREGVRIAVEFDAWFFHGHPDAQAGDDARDRGLIELGWRVLRIRSAYQLPTPEELDAALA